MTKRRDIEARINEIAKLHGWQVRKQEGGSHTKFWLGEHYLTIPRHREIPEHLGKAILEDLEELR